MARRIQVEIVGDSRSVERAFGRANKAGATFGSRMKSLAKAASIGLGAAFVGLGLALRRGFAEFMDGQKVMADTRAVVKSTGGVAHVTAKHVDQLAGSLSRMSGIDDEAIATGENMLLTFTNIRNAVGKNNDIFDQATKVVLDMSVKMHRDLQPVAIMVGKALNDLTVNSKGTITGWSALRRVGVMITPMMMAQAKSFIELGQPMKAQQLLLKELNTEFGGQARAFGGTLPAAFAKLKNATDELLGAFAEGLAPVVQKVANQLATKMANPAFVARVRELGQLVGVKLTNAFKQISAWFQANWPQIKQGFYTVLHAARTFANVLRQIVNITPGGPATLIGLIASGVLLSKILKIMAALRAAGLIGAGGKAAEGKGAAGKGGLLGKLGKKLLPLAPVGGPLAVAAAAVGGSYLYNKSQHDKAKAAFNSLTPVKQRELLQQTRIPAEYLKQLGWHLKPMKHKAAPIKRAPGTPGWVPETAFTGGAADIMHVHVHLNKREIGHAVVGSLQKAGKTNAASRRGRFGGQNLALG